MTIEFLIGAVIVAIAFATMVFTLIIKLDSLRESFEAKFDSVNARIDSVTARIDGLYALLAKNAEGEAPTASPDRTTSKEPSSKGR